VITQYTILAFILAKAEERKYRVDSSMIVGALVCISTVGCICTVGCHKVWRGQAYRLGMHSFFVNGMVSNQDGLQVVAKEAKRS
jgi:hypothetical protein